MQVTLDVYSGTPNPTWELTNADAKKLIDRLAGKALPAAAAADPVLGYRGFVVMATSDDQASAAGLPPSFRIGGIMPTEFTAAEGLALPHLAAAQADDAAQWLLTT